MPATSTSPIRVMLVDDHHLIRVGLAAVISSDKNLQVVAEAEDGQRALDVFRQHRPDVTLMDLRMPRLNGTDATRQICQEFPAARIIMLTTFDGDEDIHRALQAGARGYLLKNVSGPELISSIRMVHEGQRCIPAEVASRLAERISYSELTARELEVLRFVAQGLSNKEIGTELDMAESTAKSHVKSILSKLGVNGRTKAAAAAQERGLLH